MPGEAGAAHPDTRRGGTHSSVARATGLNTAVISPCGNLWDELKRFLRKMQTAATQGENGFVRAQGPQQAPLPGSPPKHPGSAGVGGGGRP